MLTCPLSTTVADVIKAVEHVIKRVKRTGRRSVLAIPLASYRSQEMDDAVEAAAKINIVVVTSAGKK